MCGGDGVRDGDTGMLVHGETIGAELCEALDLPPDMRITSIHIAVGEVVTATIERYVSVEQAERIIKVFRKLECVDPPEVTT